MANPLKQLFGSLLFGKDANADAGERLQKQTDASGMIFFASPQVVSELKAGRGSPAALLETVVLQMLSEQGDADEIPNGYRLDEEVVVALDQEQGELLGLPEYFPHPFVVHAKGHTRKAGFSARMFALISGQEHPLERKGPYISAGGGPSYRLTLPGLMALKEIERHADLSADERTENENLHLMAVLQTAKRSGLDVDIGAFSKLDVVVPEGVGVIATRLPDGSLELCPALGDGSSPDQLDKRWKQLDMSREGGVLRVENRLVLLEPDKMAAVREVLGSKRIPADKVEEFIQTPSAFLDASIVNLDLGFSIRVVGVGKLQHMDFGPIDTQKRDWFAVDFRPNPPEALEKRITCTEELGAFRQTLDAARNQGADSVEFQGEMFDITDSPKVDSVLANIELSLTRDHSSDNTRPANKTSKERVTLLLKDADEINQSLLDKANKRQRPHVIATDNLRRMPFEHQSEGISWMVDLMLKALTDDHEDLYRVQGALLADDMGLGKTFMALATLAEYYSVQKARRAPEKPVLVVAPLSLLENWEDEIEKTFKRSPFRDVKVLQSGRDLTEFRVKGADRESVQLTALLDENDQMNESDIRYALNIGSDAGIHRLDMDRRLVLTTYQTLRDYQFSLCVIDWGVVVFDEAQNIKNPNTLQTRAAKALKADFKLLATGTPVENSLGDFWCLMDTAQPGLLGSWTEFRDRWVAPIARASEDTRDEQREEVGASLRKAVGSYMLRRIKEDRLPGLPKKYIRTGLPFASGAGIQISDELAAVMRGSQLKAYDEIIDNYRVESAANDMRGRALSALQQLRVVSLHPRLGATELLAVRGAKQAREIMEESAKLKVLLGQLDRIRSAEEKVILFMVTKQLQMALKLWLDQIYGLNIHIINGDTAAVQKKREVLTRKSMIEDFEAVHGFNIIIMSPVAAGVGLTVVGANHVVHVERHWNPAKEAQATDRVYRIGQKKDVFIHLPAAIHPEYDSFDVNLDRLLNSKLLIKDAVVTPEVVEEAEMIRSMGF